MFERHSNWARRAIFFAHWEAQQQRAASIDTLHLLLGLCHDHDNEANQCFRLYNHYERFKAALCPTPPASLPKYLPLSRLSKRVHAYVQLIAKDRNDYWIDTIHLLVGLVNAGGLAAQLLTEIGIGADHIQEIALTREQQPWPTRQLRMLIALRSQPVQEYISLGVLVLILISWIIVVHILRS